MITLFGQEVEIYQLVLLGFVMGWSVVAGFMNTFYRFVSLFGRGFQQSTLGMCIDAVWYGCIFVLVGTLV